MPFPVKAYHGAEIRRFQTDVSSTAELRRQLLASFSIPTEAAAALQLSYVDDEGEWVTLSTDDDLSTAVGLLQAGKPLRIRFSCPSAVDETAELLNHPKVQELIGSLVNEAIQKPTFETMVQDMLPTVVKLMEQSGLGFADNPATSDARARSGFQYQRFSEVDPQSSVVLPSICLEDIDALQRPAPQEVESHDTVVEESTESLMEGLRWSLGSDEDFSLTSVDFSALSAMLEKDMMADVLLKEKERALLDHAAEQDAKDAKSATDAQVAREVTQADPQLSASSSALVEPKPQPDASTEDLTEKVQNSPVPLSRAQHTARMAEALEQSFVVLDSSSVRAEPAEGYDEADLLQSLAELGFSDEEKNKELIHVFRGDLAMIVEVLLEHDEATRAPGM
mmetsp:Transcript_20099/g.76964  ORF Transcript_20099/g.76964 Transcript_20099/m.76964 type:complete len:394 (+) Transcript_20099:205-1386(+)